MISWRCLPVFLVVVTVKLGGMDGGAVSNNGVD